MKLFKPSEKILEIICSDVDELSYSYEIYPKRTMNLNERDVRLFVPRLYSGIQEFYDLGLEIRVGGRLAYQKIWNVSGEALKNCYDHGPKNKEVLFGLFLGDKGVCYGFCDQGGYFKNEKIKNQYENKVEITEFNKRTLKDNHQSGVNENIFCYSDFIEVDSEKGILYCVQLKENIIAPEGEKGNSYFFKRDG